MFILNPKFIVLLAAFNGVKYLEGQIKSILNQKKVCVDIYISLDKSNDSSFDLCLLMSENYPNIFLLPYGDIFGGAGPNFFRLLRDVNLDSYDYLSFADQDDIWYPDKLWRSHCVLTEKNAAGYSSNVLAFWSNGKSSIIDKSQPQREWDYLFEAAGPGCTYVIRQDLAKNFQNLIRLRWSEIQEVALHDWFIYAYARANDFKWIIDPFISMSYRQHNENQVGVNVGWLAFKYRAIKVLTGWGTDQASIISYLLGLDGIPFIYRWKYGGRIGFLWLALNANKCRRRKQDRFLFALSCILLFFFVRTK